MAPYKVLYIAPSVGIGGVETFLKQISINHSESCTPYFLLFQKGPLGQWLESQDATVFYCQERPRISRPWTWILYQMELFKLIRNHKFDIVHASMSYSALFTWPCYFATKFLWFQHGPVSKHMDKWAYRLPHHAIIYNSAHTLQQQLLVNSKQSRRSDDFILHLGTPSVDIDRRNTAREDFIQKHNLAQETIIISMACRLQRWKGVDVAISAIDEIRKTTNTPVALFIYGDNSWDKAYHNELLRQSKNLPVYFSEPATDIHRIFLASDMVINSSTTPEPFGLTIIEAMSCGAAPIAARHGGPEEILSFDLNECLFTPSSAKDLARTIMQFTDDHRKLSIAKAKSFELYEQKFTLGNMIGHLESIYREILSTK